MSSSIWESSSSTINHSNLFKSCIRKFDIVNQGIYLRSQFLRLEMASQIKSFMKIFYWVKSLVDCIFVHITYVRILFHTVRVKFMIHHAFLFEIDVERMGTSCHLHFSELFPLYFVSKMGNWLLSLFIEVVLYNSMLIYLDIGFPSGRYSPFSSPPVILPLWILNAHSVTCLMCH